MGKDISKVVESFSYKELSNKGFIFICNGRYAINNENKKIMALSDGDYKPLSKKSEEYKKIKKLYKEYSLLIN
jgi:hypothetical protein